MKLFSKKEILREFHFHNFTHHFVLGFRLLENKNEKHFPRLKNANKFWNMITSLKLTETWTDEIDWPMTADDRQSGLGGKNVTNGNLGDRAKAIGWMAHPD